MISYTELHCKSNFSFLEGASHPDELVRHASELGYQGIALTDRETLAGVVRGFGAARDLDFKYLVGAELHLPDAPSMVVWPTDRAAYGRLCRLLSTGRLRCEKGSCELSWLDVVEHSEGMIAAVIPGYQRGDEVEFLASRFREQFAQRGYILAEVHRGPDDQTAITRLKELSRATDVPLVAAGNVHYHSADRMLLHDCVTAIRNGTTIESVHEHRFANSQHHLRTLDEIEELYQQIPQAIENTNLIADQCRFSLDQLRYEYPEELVPDGKTPIEHLKRLAWEGAQQRWPDGVPDKIIDLLRYESSLIEEMRYEAYFLTVWDMVRFARSQGILCQGRGSAANSAVCYCLGITNVDPAQSELLFERFISRERNEAPDIDVDFEHQRREEVLQYLYTKYGRDRAGMTATVVTYRTRSAIRETGKALGLSEDLIDTLAKFAGGHRSSEGLTGCMTECGLPPESETGQRFLFLVNTLTGFPRHLSQHVGGMVMTQGQLSELCPIENAAMDGRTVIQWDKDDLDELGILKVDVLALGMLSALHRCIDLVAKHHGTKFTLATIPHDDKPTYDMICEADTIGVFQIESRAQMSMLPRLRPRCFYDLVIEVAIVRPGPIQGDMVHPYLKARDDPDSVVYPNDAIRRVLEKTLGVPLFQEQAMRLAVVAAGFTPGEADQLRRAMAAWRRPGVIETFRTKLLDGMRENGLTGKFADQVFRQIRGFGEYGFPESHAASFALLVYASCFLKRHYPAAFCAAILNSQPMGFYAPAQLVDDARKHGVRVRPVCVNASDWESTLENDANRDGPALRLGLSSIRGLPAFAIEQLMEERTRNGPYEGVDDLSRRTRLGPAVLATLADSDALANLSGDRRAAVWQSLGQDTDPDQSPLLQSLEDDEPIPDELTSMTPLEEVNADYNSIGLSLKAHPISFARDQLSELRCVQAEQLAELRDGRHVRVAGMVLLRQRPGTAKGITFVTIEDETGTINLVLFPKIWERFFKIAKMSNAWLVDGKLENRKGVIHVIVGRLTDMTEAISGVEIRSRDFR